MRTSTARLDAGAPGEIEHSVAFDHIKAHARDWPVCADGAAAGEPFTLSDAGDVENIPHNHEVHVVSEPGGSRGIVGRFTDRYWEDLHSSDGKDPRADRLPVPGFVPVDRVLGVARNARRQAIADYFGRNARVALNVGKVWA